MQTHIISGTISLPQKQRQQQLYQQLGEFAVWMSQTKNASEVQKDKRKSVPTALLPMVF